MAHVHVLVGQCGNQLGTTFLDNLVAEARASDEDGRVARRVSAVHFRPSPTPSGAAVRRGPAATIPPSSFFPPPPLPRCVMIDMEPKVIEGIFASSGDAGAYRPHVRQCVTRDEGSANNWAFGFYSQGSSRREDIVDSLRHESESCGTVGAFHVVHSIAGGTGSGVGCLVADIVREEFPRALLIHSVVWPFSTGEVVTQWYNSVMAMSALRDTADAVFMAYNDDFGHVPQAGKTGVGAMNKSEVSFYTINDNISRLMVDLHLPQDVCFAPLPPQSLEQPQAQLFSPASPASSSSLLEGGGERMPIDKNGRVGYKRQTHFGVSDNLRAGSPVAPSLRRATLFDIVESVALDPALKFFSGVALPANAAPHAPRGSECGPSSWGGLLREAARKSKEFFLPCVGLPAVGATQPQRRSCLWSLRGPAVHSEGLAALRSTAYFSSFSPFTGLVLVDEGRYRGHAAHVSVFGHTRNIGVRLSTALRRAEELLSVDAFTHHFSRYGVGKDDLQDAIVRLWDTAALYTPLSE